MILDFGKDYNLENERVKLKPLQDSQYVDLKSNSSDHEIWKFFDEGGISEKDFKTYWATAKNKREQAKQYPFSVFDKVKNQYIGMTRFYAYDPVLKNIKLGHTWIGVGSQGNGLNKATKHCLLQFAFENLEIERVGFGVHEENVKSIKAMKRVGAVKEGVLRNFLQCVESQDRCDLFLFSITKSDWHERVNKNLSNQYKSYLTNELLNKTFQ